MTDKSLLPTGEQLPLIPSSQMPDGIFAEQEKKGEFTGARLAVRDPKRYQEIMSMLAEGLSGRFIAEHLNVSEHTVARVRDNEPGPIAALKTKIAQGARAISRMCLEGIRDALLDPKTKVSARDQAIIFGIVTDKAELLSGSPTGRFEITDREPGHAEVLAYLAKLKQEYDAEQMGLSAENGKQKEIDVTPEVEVSRPEGSEEPAGAQEDSKPTTAPAGGESSETARSNDSATSQMGAPSAGNEAEPSE